jgi:hypothetical protein
MYFQVEFDDEGKVRGVTSEGETAKGKKVVCDPSYVPEKVKATHLHYLNKQIWSIVPKRSDVTNIMLYFPSYCFNNGTNYL